MVAFVTELKEEVRQKLRVIELTEPDILTRALSASEMLEEVFCKLKEFISSYTFRDEQEEIQFFKVEKPSIFCHLLFYRKVYNIEMNRPMGTLEDHVAYLNRELELIRQYAEKRLDLFRYYRSGLTNMDSIYFLRGRKDSKAQYLDSFYFERDPVFSSAGDFIVSKILANDMLQAFVRRELEIVGKKQLMLFQTPELPLDLPRWTDKKTGLIEILYALDSLNSIENGKLSLNRLASHFEFAFDINLGNFTCAFNEMKIRNNQTPYLDLMKEALLKRMNETEASRMLRPGKR